MFPHGLTSSGRVAARRASDSIKTVEIAWTRVHAISKSTTCAKERVSDEDQTPYLAPRGNLRTSWSASNRRAWDASDGRDYSQSRSADRHRTVQRRCGRTLRSSRDRGAIEPRSHAFCRGIDSTRADDDRWSSRITIDARSRPDRGAIVVRSWQKLEAFWPRNPVKIGAGLKPFFAKCNRSHDALKRRPRPLQLATIFGSISLFRSMYSPLLFLNFWSTREEIKRVSRKISSSSCSPRV